MKDCDTLLMVGSSFPYSEFLPEEGQARGVQIDIDGRMVGIRYPMEVNLIGDSALTLRRCCRCSSARRIAPGASRSKARCTRLVAAARAARELAGRPDQPAARLPGALQAPAGRRDPHRRLGLGGQLVRARREAARGHDGLAVGHARDDGRGRALRDRRQVRAPGPPRDRARRRRRDADERHRRADHDGEVPRPLARPAPDRAGAQQPRPQPGDLGAARDVGRPEVRGLAGPARRPLRALGRADRTRRDPRRAARGDRGSPGIGRSRPIARR